MLNPHMTLEEMLKDLKRKYSPIMVGDFKRGIWWCGEERCSRSPTRLPQQIRYYSVYLTPRNVMLARKFAPRNMADGKQQFWPTCTSCGAFLEYEEGNIDT
jgi:hypothetical protein